MTKYFIRQPNFPINAYIGYITLILNDHTGILYPLDDIYPNVDDFRQDIKNFNELFNSEKISIGSESVILPLKFKEKIQHKKSYWEGKHVFYDPKERIKLLINLINYNNIYKLLVTPRSVSKGKEKFQAAIPLLNNSIYSQSDIFMKISDFPVDKSAANSAIYEPGEPYGINWIKGSLITNPPLFKYNDPAIN